MKQDDKKYTASNVWFPSNLWKRKFHELCMTIPHVLFRLWNKKKVCFVTICAYLPAVLMLKSIKFLRECTLKTSWHVLCCEDIAVPFKKKKWLKYNTSHIATACKGTLLEIPVCRYLWYVFEKFEKSTYLK